MTICQSILDALNVKGIRIVTFTAFTIPRLAVGNPFGGKTMNHSLRKHAGSQWLIGPASTLTAPGFYSTVVNRRLEKEGSTGAGSFVADSTWGSAVVRADGSALPYVEHTPKGGEPTLYLPGIHLRSLHREYRLCDNTLVPTVDAERWVPERVEGGRQGLSEPVVYRKYQLAHITQLRSGGEIIEGDAMRLVDAMRAGDTATVEAMIHDYAG